MIKNCKIAGINVDSRVYHKPQEFKRGEPGYVMSSSSLRSFWACPSKWVEPIVAQDGTVSYWEFAGSKSTEWGDLFDCMLLTPDHFSTRYVVRPKQYEERAKVCPKCQGVADSNSCRKCGTDRVEAVIKKDWSPKSSVCQQWVEEQEKAGKTVVTETDMFNVGQAVARFMRDPILNDIVTHADKQVEIRGEWHDPETGLIIPTRCLLDVVPHEDSAFHKSLADVKTTKCARVIPFASWAHTAGYEIQAAFGTDHFVSATNREILAFRLLLSENHAPWQTGRRMMSQDLIDPRSDMGDIASGRRQYERMLADYAKCLKTGKWPDFDDTDEAVGGFSILAPSPWDEQKRAFAPKMAFGEAEEPGQEEEMDEVVP